MLVCYKSLSAHNKSGFRADPTSVSHAEGPDLIDRYKTEIKLDRLDRILDICSKTIVRLFDCSVGVVSDGN